MARSLDPSVLMVDAGLTPDQWQADVMRSKARKLLMLCSRQAGKSTVAAALALWTALYEGGLTLLVSPSQRQSGEIFRKVTELFAALPDMPKPVAESALRLDLGNGARIVSLPGTEQTIRGYSGAGMIILDEAARIDDELIAALRPMLATTDGRFIGLSTPAGQRGWFYDTWQEGEGWERYKTMAKDIPRISPEFLADEERELGPMMYRQEYECSFEDTDEAMFPSHLIDRAITEEVKPLWG
jgi:hypothetical protein